MLDEEHRESNDRMEVEALQRYLRKFGYYDGAKDGDFGAITKQAVTDWQTAAALNVDGVAGPKTRAAIVGKKRCDNLDPFAANDVVDGNVNFAESGYSDKKEIAYSIGVHPGYLQRDAVERAIGSACSQWAESTPLSFEMVDDQKSADIVFSWKMFDRADDPLRFDGTGGVLGRAGNGFVHFDLAERWAVDDEELSDLFDPKTWHRGQPTISLFYTALHELGHALGLVHSVQPGDVMSPWYDPTQSKPSENDIARLREVIGAE